MENFSQGSWEKSIITSSNVEREREREREVYLKTVICNNTMIHCTQYIIYHSCCLLCLAGMQAKIVFKAFHSSLICIKKPLHIRNCRILQPSSASKGYLKFLPLSDILVNRVIVGKHILHIVILQTCLCKF